MDNKEAVEILDELPDRIVGVILPSDRFYDYKEALNFAVEHLEADRWIPVSERLPEKAGEYLCALHYAIPPYNMFHPEKDVYVDAINVQGFDGTAFVSSVIAWRPLPKPYESEAGK